MGYEKMGEFINGKKRFLVPGLRLLVVVLYVVLPLCRVFHLFGPIGTFDLVPIMFTGYAFGYLGWACFRRIFNFDDVTNFLLSMFVVLFLYVCVVSGVTILHDKLLLPWISTFSQSLAQYSTAVFVFLLISPIGALSAIGVYSLARECARSIMFPLAQRFIMKIHTVFQRLDPENRARNDTKTRSMWKTLDISGILIILAWFLSIFENGNSNVEEYLKAVINEMLKSEQTDGTNLILIVYITFVYVLVLMAFRGYRAWKNECLEREQIAARSKRAFHKYR